METWISFPPACPSVSCPEFGPWVAQDIPLTDDTLEVLGKGDFLNRIYTAEPTNGRATVPPVSLFIGYFPTQRTGQTMHSPLNCLPGAGWTFDSKQYVDIQDINGKTYHVGEYVITNGDIKQFVIYWYQAHGRSIPNEFAAKGHMVLDAIRTNRTDGALVSRHYDGDAVGILFRQREIAQFGLPSRWRPICQDSFQTNHAFEIVA